jgi:hypothetical protein
VGAESGVESRGLRKNVFIPVRKGHAKTTGLNSPKPNPKRETGETNKT